MEKLKHLLSALEDSIDSNTKQHMLSGIMFSVSLLCIGLSVTLITLKLKQEKEGNHE